MKTLTRHSVWSCCVLFGLAAAPVMGARMMLLPAGVLPGDVTTWPYTYTATGGETIEVDVWAEDTDPEAVSLWQVQMPCIAGGGEGGYVEFTSRTLDEARADYIFLGLTTLGLGGSNGSCPGGGLPGDPFTDAPTSGTLVVVGTPPVVTAPKYVCTWTFAVSDVATGLFTLAPVCYYDDPNPDCSAELTFLVKPNANTIPFTMEPLLIDVPVGQCCAGGICVGDYAEWDCLNNQGGTAWDPGRSCDTDACPCIVPPGQDCYDVGCELTYFTFGLNPMPAGFFAPGSEPFDGVISFRGSDAETDMIIERFQPMDLCNPADPTDKTSIELVSLELTSCEPMIVQPGDIEWNVLVELSNVTPPAGTLNAERTHENGGVFTMAYNVQPKFTFSRVDDASDVRFFDTGGENIPAIPFTTVGEVPFVFEASIDVSPCGENFVPGVEEGAGRGRDPCEEECNTNQSCGPGGCSGGIPEDCSDCPAGACYSRNPDTYGECQVVVASETQSARWLCEREPCPSGSNTHCGVYFGNYSDCASTDGDTIPDVFEGHYDPASDTCLTADPWETKTNKLVPDTDFDGCDDGLERTDGTDPCDPCSFSSGCVNVADSDEDGCLDGDEVDAGTDPCDPCDPPDGCPGFDDCNNNSKPDACDVVSGLDCDGDGQINCDPPPGNPDLIGACCSGLHACGETWKEDCEASVHDFRGLCTTCPTTGGGVADHNGVVVRHFPASEPPLDICVDGRASGDREDCVPGDLIDPWTTHPIPEMCHQFGVDSSVCPAGCPDCSPPIPAGFFGPGSDPFDGEVCLEGVPLESTPWGYFETADTLIKRTADPFNRCDLPSGTPSTVGAEVVALSLKSVEPITVTFDGGQNPELWDVTVSLSDTGTPPLGEVTAVKTHCNGGTYFSELHLYPKFTLTRVGGGGEKELDSGLTADCAVTLIQLEADAEPWVSDLAPGIEDPAPFCTDFHPAMEDLAPEVACDCNSNAVRDLCDIEEETSQDCNGSTIPDDCELIANDCNSNTIPDDCDVAETDCNGNGIPDDCELNENDCNGNDVPDECENDCNGNQRADQCDVPAPAGNCTVNCSVDCNENGMPDECEPDCNGNGVPDGCDIVGQTSPDCQLNGRPDECDIASGVSLDCQGNGQPDECDIAGAVSPDCNANAVPDECETLCVVDQDCDDSDECTVDACDCGNPEAGVNGCVNAYQPRPYGDVTPFASVVPPCTSEDAATIGDGFTNMLDVFCAFNAFNEGTPYTECPCADVAPCDGDSFVNMLDVFVIFAAFNNTPTCPDPCP